MTFTIVHQFWAFESVILQWIDNETEVNFRFWDDLKTIENIPNNERYFTNLIGQQLVLL